MKKINIEQIIRDLRVRSTFHKGDEHLEQLLAVHDRWYQTRIKRLRSRRLTVTWVASLAIAAMIILIIYLAVPSNPSAQMNPDKRQTMAVPPVGIVTVDTLQRAFCQGGLEGLEKQLDQSLKSHGPEPVNLTTQDLF